jgi:carbonic anhydrase
MTTIDDIQQGVLRFRKKVFPIRRAIYEELARHQDPQILFITCIDSRVDPAELCDTDPGDMFVDRTPGSLVPVYNGAQRSGISASIEYAVTALNVTDIIICGHSDCGALKALLYPEKLAALPAVERWLHFADAAIAHVQANHAGKDEHTMLQRLCEQAVITQLGHMETHPCVQQRIADGTLRIHGWVYEIHTGEVQRYDPATRAFALWPPPSR